MARVLRAGHISDAIGCSIALADIRIAQGRLHEAMSTYERGLQLATKLNEPALRGTADMYVGMSMLKREHNDLNAATQHLLRSKELGEHIGLPQNRYRWCVAMAGIREAQGDLDGALDLLNEAERLYVSDFSPNVRPVDALRTRVWLAQGRLGDALAWAQEKRLSVEDELSYLHEFEHITLARILLARYKSDHADRTILEVMGLLERLLKAAEEGGRVGSAIEILILQALAHHAHGDIPAALQPLQQALALAEPEDYVRKFVDEGEPMRLLIEDCRPAPAVGQVLQIENQSSDQNQHLLAYIDKLLSAFPQPAGALQSVIRKPQSTTENHYEPLSQRELEILRLFKTELSGPEIADQLVIALSTVRSHTKSIYSKLNVNNRRAAVKRAAELDLM
jgi:LuxR family maltose regulon positive regulatory protein